MNSTKFRATSPLQADLRDEISSISQVSRNNCQLKRKYFRIYERAYVNPEEIVKRSIQTESLTNSIRNEFV